MRTTGYEEVNLLELAPVRRAGWRESGERVVVERPEPRRRGLRALGEWLGYLLAPRRLRLDDMGTFVWKRLDGSTTVGEIAQQMRTEMGARAEPVEERLGQYVRLLWREDLIGYPDELPSDPSGP